MNKFKILSYLPSLNHGKKLILKVLWMITTNIFVKNKHIMKLHNIKLKFYKIKLIITHI